MLGPRGRTLVPGGFVCVRAPLVLRPGWLEGEFVAAVVATEVTTWLSLGAARTTPSTTTAKTTAASATARDGESRRGCTAL